MSADWVRRQDCEPRLDLWRWPGRVHLQDLDVAEAAQCAAAGCPVRTEAQQFRRTEGGTVTSTLLKASSRAVLGHRPALASEADLFWQGSQAKLAIRRQGSVQPVTQQL